MNKMLNYRISKNRAARTTLKFEIDIKKIFGLDVLDTCEVEKSVLDNWSKIELMQFLGLKDKNGKLIYFGDILADEFNNLLTPVIEISNAEHILYFKPLHHLNTSLNIGCKSTYSNTLKVVGNIYKNSELFTGMQETDRILKMILSANYKGVTKTTIQIELNNPVYN